MDVLVRSSTSFISCFESSWCIVIDRRHIGIRSSISPRCDRQKGFAHASAPHPESACFMYRTDTYFTIALGSFPFFVIIASKHDEHSPYYASLHSCNQTELGTLTRFPHITLEHRIILASASLSIRPLHRCA